jgi:hypothetical protein
MASLVDKSLLRQQRCADDEVRFHMLETIRVYALEQLAAHGQAEATQRRHAAYFVAFAEQAEPGLWGREIGRWLVRLDREHANLRTALRRLLAWGQPEAAERLASAIGLAWQGGGRLAEGRAWLEELLGAPESPSRPRMRAKLLLVAGSLAVTHGDLMTARVLFEAVTPGGRRSISDSSALSLLNRATTSPPGRSWSVRSSSPARPGSLEPKPSPNSVWAGCVSNYLKNDMRRAPG